MKLFEPSFDSGELSESILPPLRNITTGGRSDIKKRLFSNKNINQYDKKHLPPIKQQQQHLKLIQTDPILIQLPLRLPTSESDAQTDEFLPQISTSKYIPKQSGVDVGIQANIFDFDTEVTPIVDVLIGKVIEQAYFEINQENELEMLRGLMSGYESRREQERVVVVRMEEEERRRQEEKRRRLEEVERKRIERAKDSARLDARVIEDISSGGGGGENSKESNDHDKIEIFITWLNESIQEYQEEKKIAYELLDDILLAAIVRM